MAGEKGGNERVSRGEGEAISQKNTNRRDSAHTLSPNSNSHLPLQKGEIILKIHMMEFSLDSAKYHNT